MLEIIYLLIATHLTILSVTLYLHRSQSHRSVIFHPAVAHFMRFWLWLTTGMVTKEWVAIHRKHHQASDTPTDPHSPKIHGIWRVLFGEHFYMSKQNKIATWSIHLVAALLLIGWSFTYTVLDLPLALAFSLCSTP